MNPKYQKVCAEIAKTEKKVEDLQGQLKERYDKKTELENLEIVNTVRAMVMDKDQIMAFLAAMKDGKAEKALESVHKYLETKHGIVLLQPAYKEYHLELGEVSSYPPGYKENAGIFCHNNPWIIAAETVVGHGDRAFDLYSRIAPAYREEISDLHKMEPYVYSQMIAGKDAPNFGQAKNSWLTGTAAWNFYVISNYILGIKPDWEGLKVDPCIPHTWDGYQVSRRFRGATYAIAIENPSHVCRGVKQVTVDGQAIEGNILPVFADGKTHQVTVTLG